MKAARFQVANVNGEEEEEQQQHNTQVELILLHPFSGVSGIF